MSFRNTRWFLGIAVGGAIALGGNPASAQITSDTTLPNNSTVTINGNTFNIDGGTQAGRNLFHSFQQFSVPKDNTASFNNAVNIQNIFSRVTGGSVSNINGLIRANGTANLFLINPNGIIFGPNASLNVGGSFVGTTANAIQFGNQGFWSATNPNNPALLTVNPSALFFNQIAAAARIENNSTPTGLRVPDGRSLLLVGGDINMNGGGLFAFGGRVELGGLRSPGTVGLNGDGNNLSLSFPDNVERSNVSLSNGALVYVAAGDGGSIAVNARNLEMTGNSGLFAGIGGLGSDNTKAGNISINATGAINLNNGSFIANQVLPGANGQGGDVSISASSLRLSGGAQVSASTFGAGKGGNLRVDAQDVQLIGTAGGQFFTGFRGSAEQNSTGDAGDLTVKTNTLLVRDGAQVNTTTSGAGKGGNLSVDAQDVQIIGTDDGQSTTALSASAQPNSTGDAGDLTIKTNTLLVRRAQILTNTFGAGKGGNLSVDAQDVQIIGIVTTPDGQFPSALLAQASSTGNAGNLNVKTNTLLVRDGAQVAASTLGAGKGGNLSVDAQDVQIIGTTPDGQNSSGLFVSANRNSTGNAGDLTIKTNTLLVRDGAQVAASTFGAGKGGNLRVDAQDVQLIGTSADGRLPSGLFAQANSSSTGDAGDLNVKTNTLLVRNGATVSANTLGQGKDRTSQAGNLEINAREINLDNGVITATTNSGNGGNIFLTLKDLLLLRNNSTISTSAGTAQAGGNGGNIQINTPNTPSGFIVAFPGENNDITANAFNGSGGQVSISTFGNYELQPLSGAQLRTLNANSNPRELPTNDISAVSQQGGPQLDGRIFINDPNTDLSNSFVSLPADVFDLSDQIAQGCSAFDQANASDFKVTGRGGLPPSPDEPLSSDAVWEDTRLGATTPQRLDSKTTATKPKSESESDTVEIIPATGWVFNGKGEVTLVSQTPNATVENLAASSQSCHLR